MKTKKYSISMKAVFTAMFLFAISAFVNAQFEMPYAPATQGGEEVRSTVTGVSVDYDLTLNHVLDEEYRWVVRGGTITAGGAVTSDGDSSIVEWTANADVITVSWDTDLSLTPVGSSLGEIIVQKRNASGCATQLQVLPITMWNPPDAEIDPAEVDLDVCSLDPTAGTITINLTGAPDGGGNDGFDLIYDVAVSSGDLTVSGLNGPVGAGQVVTSDGPTVTITLPDALINVGSTPEDYTITLVSVQDDFNSAPVAIAGEVYTITVNPTPTTGTINSSSSLTRR